MVRSADTGIPLAVVALGGLIAVLPFLVLPESSGPVAFALGLVQWVAVLVGLGVTASGLYSYRTGDLRPAVTTALTILGLGLVSAVGGVVETSGGPLVPIWAWVVSVILVGVLAIAVTNRMTGRRQQNGV